MQSTIKNMNKRVNPATNFEINLPTFIDTKKEENTNSKSYDKSLSKDLKKAEHEIKKLSKKYSKEEIDLMLIENFVTLQHTMTNMAERFDVLSTNISKLLALFELSAKSFVEKNTGVVVTKEDKELIEKLDRLMDQNKTIAKVLMIMENRVKTKTGETPQVNQQQSLQNGSIQNRPNRLPQI